jgi:hypothetical protein
MIFIFYDILIIVYFYYNIKIIYHIPGVILLTAHLLQNEPQIKYHKNRIQPIEIKEIILNPNLNKILPNILITKTTNPTTQ